MTEPYQSTPAEAAPAGPRTIRPESGPISLLAEGEGEDEERFQEAITAAGGRVVPLGQGTRGLVQLFGGSREPLLDALERYPRIGWVQLPLSGIEAVAPALEPHAGRGVLFTSAKGAYAEPVAEHALALTLAALRQLPRRARATQWQQRSGLSLYDARVLILGAGGIAGRLLELLAPFRARVTIARRRAELAVPGAEATVDLPGFRSLLPQADAVILAAAATPATRGVIGEAELRSLRPTAVLVNVARGALVDTEALLAALDAGRLWGAGLDVTAPEPLPTGHRLFGHERAIVTPHTADTPEMVAPLLAERVRRNTAAFLGGGEFLGVADPRLGY